MVTTGRQGPRVRKTNENEKQQATSTVRAGLKTNVRERLSADYKTRELRE